MEVFGGLNGRSLPSAQTLIHPLSARHFCWDIDTDTDSPVMASTLVLYDHWRYFISSMTQMVWDMYIQDGT